MNISEIFIRRPIATSLLMVGVIIMGMLGYSLLPISALPRPMPNPATYAKVNPADQPILTLSLTSDSLPLEKVNDLTDTVLAQKLSEVTGVGLVTIEGNQKPAVRVRINPSAIASLGTS